MGKKTEHKHEGPEASIPDINGLDSQDLASELPRRRGGKLTPGLKEIVSEFRTHLEKVRDFEVYARDPLQVGETFIDDPEFLALKAEVDASNRESLYGMRQEGYGMYLYLRRDPRSKDLADKALRKDARRRKKMGLPVRGVPPPEKKVKLNKDLKTSYDNATWDFPLDPDAPRRIVPDDESQEEQK